MQLVSLTGKKPLPPRLYRTMKMWWVHSSFQFPGTAPMTVTPRMAQTNEAAWQWTNPPVQKHSHPLFFFSFTLEIKMRPFKVLGSLKVQREDSRNSSSNTIESGIAVDYRHWRHCSQGRVLTATRILWAGAQIIKDSSCYRGFGKQTVKQKASLHPLLDSQASILTSLSSVLILPNNHSFLHKQEFARKILLHPQSRCRFIRSGTTQTCTSGAHLHQSLPATSLRRMRRMLSAELCLSWDMAASRSPCLQDDTQLTLRILSLQIQIQQIQFLKHYQM